MTIKCSICHSPMYAGGICPNCSLSPSNDKPACGSPNAKSDHQPSGIEAEVCADIAARQQLGIKKYGTTVDNNPLTELQWLQHAYEESLDLPIYLKKLIKKMSGVDCPQCDNSGRVQPDGDQCEWCHREPNSKFNKSS